MHPLHKKCPLGARTHWHTESGSIFCPGTRDFQVDVHFHPGKYPSQYTARGGIWWHFPGMFSLAGYYSARVLALFWWFSKWPILFGQILGKLIAYACIQILTVLKKVYPQSKNYHLFILLLTSECLHAQKTTGTSAGDHQCPCASLCVLQQSRFTTHKCTGHLEVIHRGVLGKGLYHISLSYIA